MVIGPGNTGKNGNSYDFVSVPSQTKKDALNAEKLLLGTPIDLSSLVFDENISSRILYGLLLVSSVASVCMSFTAILKGGRRPIIHSYSSVFFFKTFLFILSKFMVQAYVLSIAIKSLMYYVAHRDVLRSGLLGDIFNIYFRGICRPTYRHVGLGFIYSLIIFLKYVIYFPLFSFNPNYHPICREPEALTFTLATLYSPLLYLALLFLPTIIYVEIISYKKYGLSKVAGKLVENTVYSVFAVVTNISFFNHASDSSRYIETEGSVLQRSHSVPNFTNV